MFYGPFVLPPRPLHNLHVRQQMIVDRLVVEDGIVKGVVGQTGATYLAKAVILATGTYLKGRVIIGEYSEECGPNGQRSAKLLSGNMKELGLKVVRFKTGTPARVDYYQPIHNHLFYR